MTALSAISPLDGRYHDKVRELSPYFSETALMRYRLMVEVEYFLTLGEEPAIAEMPAVRPAIKKRLRSWYENFSLADAEEVKKIESTTKHDVKAIEYFFKAKLEKTNLKKYSEFIHFALTSEDTNNLAYTLMWRDGLYKVVLPEISSLLKILVTFAKEHRRVSLLSLTHGQPATPTTVGKELAVFVSRLKRKVERIKYHKLLGKLNGATGTWAAHVICYPNVNWPLFSKKFVESFGLAFNPLTTQIEPHDSMAENFRLMQHINIIMLDFCRDIWLYISRGILGQIKKEGEVGSSTMPHKINPIHFENAEGNLGLANAIFSHLAEKLTISRMQRDLSDSTVLRNCGVPLAHSLLALKSIETGMARLTVNQKKLNEELEDHWEVLAEAIQTVLRKVGHKKPYEKLKELTRGQKITKEEIRKFISDLDIPKDEKDKLLRLTPQTYIGLASKLF